MRKEGIVVILCLLVGFSCSHFGKRGSIHSLRGLKDATQINLKVKKYTLRNGLRVLIYENHRLPIFSYYTFFKVGGRHEGPGTTGATHFLEHMMFKGAKKYGPGQFDGTIEGNGGHTNAYTNFDSTVYYESISSKMLEKIIDMEADRMQHLLLNPVAFESERQVIFEERKMRYENRDNGKLYLKMMQSVFEGTPYGGSVIGDVEDLKALKRNNLMDFFKKFYTPDNAIIVVAGDVDAEKTITFIRQKFGHLKSSSRKIKKYKAKKDALSNYRHRGRYGRHVKLRGESPTPMFLMAYPGMALGSRESYIMDILSSILGDGASSYLSQKYVRGKKPRLTSVYASNYTLMFNGVFFVGGKFLPKVNLKSTLRKIKRDLVKVCVKNLNERSLQKTKNQYLIDYFSGIQTNAGVAQFIGSREMYYNDYSHYKKEIEIYDSVSLDEVRASCKRIFAGKPITVSIWKNHPKS